MTRYFNFMVAVVSLPAMALAKPYPQNAQRAFIQNCAGYERDLINPCQCVLTKMEEAIPYEEFETIIKSENPLQNKRVAAATRTCIDTQ